MSRHNCHANTDHKAWPSPERGFDNSSRANGRRVQTKRCVADTPRIATKHDRDRTPPIPVKTRPIGRGSAGN
jgi:hypothetical protein